MKLKHIKTLAMIGILTLVSTAYPVHAEVNNVKPVGIEQTASEANKFEATILVEQAKLRENPSPEADIINFLQKDIIVTVQERIDDFYAVEIGDVKGYIYKGQIDETGLTTVPYTTTLPQQEEVVMSAPVSRGSEVVKYAKQFLGNPYVYGGNSLTNGVDCSGFTSQIYKSFGVNLQRTSRAQYSSNGYSISRENIASGDLVFYGYNGYIDHVAIYAGNGQIVHANSSKTGIIISRMDYGKPIVGIKRVID